MFRSRLLMLGPVMILMLSSCTSGEQKKRPSPLESDSTTVQDAKISIHYSSPGVKKRQVWGELVPYGEIWRTGANKATYFATNQNITIENQALEAGKYALFTLPTDSTWTIIFNKEWDQWGAYDYDREKDALRLQVTPRKSDYTERMTFSFADSTLKFEWENLYYTLKIGLP